MRIGHIQQQMLTAYISSHIIHKHELSIKVFHQQMHFLLILENSKIYSKTYIKIAPPLKLTHPVFTPTLHLLTTSRATPKIIIIIIIIFINCKWVGTRWQWLFYMYTECDIDYY
jgi:hypothetical protein